jgi:O-antigen ligase
MAAFIVLPLVALKLTQSLVDFHAFAAGSGMGTSQGQRLVLWGMSVREIAMSPVLGIGPGNFDAVMDRYCQLNACTAAFRGFHGVHNQYLDSFMNAGVFGFLGLLTSFVAPLVLFLRRSQRSAERYSISASTGAAVVAAAMVSAFTQVLYGHNISVISYFFTLTFLWFLSSPLAGECEAASEPANP